MSNALIDGVPFIYSFQKVLSFMTLMLDHSPLTIEETYIKYINI